MLMELRGIDAAGNAGPSQQLQWYVDTVAPSMAPTFSVNPGAATVETSASFAFALLGDDSPGQTVFRYSLTPGNNSVPVRTVPVPNNATVTLDFVDLTPGTTYVLDVWAVDQAGWRSQTAQHQWRVVANQAQPMVLRRPAPSSGRATARFVFSALSTDALSLGEPVPEASFLVSVDSKPEQAACVGSGCGPGKCNGAYCEFNVTVTTEGSHSLAVRAVLSQLNGTLVVNGLWNYVKCTSDYYSLFNVSAVPNGPYSDGVTCVECPKGGDCSVSLADNDGVTESWEIVAASGYWASANGRVSNSVQSGTAAPPPVFYSCTQPLACQAGVNGTVSRCAPGYEGVACSVCENGWFEQFGRCSRCPSTSDGSVYRMVAGAVIVVVLFGLLFYIRALLPIDSLKVGLSLLQVIASANSAYNIPWPPAFKSLLDALQVVLVDIISLTRANCAQPMDYLMSVLVLVISFKIIIAIALSSAFLKRLVLRASRWALGVLARLRGRGAARSSARPGGAAETSTPRQPLRPILTKLSTEERTSTMRLVFLLLFIAYPGVSLKLLRVFKCRTIDDESWLVADMRLQCFTGKWIGFAIYAIIMIAIYTVGFPLAVLAILYRRRRHLFGPGSELNQQALGFSYLAYGPTAPFWEVEELVRKLLLSAVVVLLDAGSPLQATLAVLVSGWAHVLHATYKPWLGSVVYYLQHGSLFVTSFVFLMGLLFKVEGVSSSSPTYTALSIIMLLVVGIYLLCWLLSVCRSVALAAHAARTRVVLLAADKAGDGAASTTPRSPSRLWRGLSITRRGPGTDAASGSSSVPQTQGTSGNAAARAPSARTLLRQPLRDGLGTVAGAPRALSPESKDASAPGAGSARALGRPSSESAQPEVLSPGPRSAAHRVLSPAASCRATGAHPTTPVGGLGGLSGDRASDGGENVFTVMNPMRTAQRAAQHLEDAASGGDPPQQPQQD